MYKTKVNFVYPNDKKSIIGDIKKKQPTGFLVLFLLLLLFFGSGGVFIWKIFSAYSANSISEDGGIISGFTREIKNVLTIGGLTRSEDRKIRGEDLGRVNILLLGMGGAGHEGAYLTDTIMLASLNTKKNEAALISIPRDLYAPIEGFGWNKINHAYAFGQTKYNQLGGELASRSVSKIFGVPIDYYVSVDFNGFIKIIDDLGEITVDVPVSFTDEKYPDNNFGYEVLHFEKGIQKMDGKRALKYVRSRHGNNGQGSDFSRAARQQQVIRALREEATDFSFWFSPKKIGTVLADFDDHVKTNLKSWEIINLAKKAGKIDFSNIRHIVLDDSSDGELYAASFSGAYVLLPKNNDYGSLMNIARNVFIYEKIDPVYVNSSKEENTKVAEAIDKQKEKFLEVQKKDIIKKDDLVRIEIQNGTFVSGLAGKTAKKLKGKGYEVENIGNANKQDRKNTIIYDFTSGKKLVQAKKLRADLDVKDLKILNANPEANKQVDFLVILGEDLAG